MAEITEGTLFFDGLCGMCTRSRNLLLRRFNRTGRVHTEPLQSAGTAERLGISPEKLLESVWWLDSSGAVCGGAEAVNAAVAAGLGTRLPTAIYRVPGAGRLEEAVYGWVAANRYRFPGTTPYCEAHPVAC
jgi:predicted DCC family thiol-disulfide oxidoreductase YuxK